MLATGMMAVVKNLAISLDLYSKQLGENKEQVAESVKSETIESKEEVATKEEVTEEVQEPNNNEEKESKEE
jgi:hypothetical protein